MRLKEKDYWLGFNVFKGIGKKRFAKILAIFGSAKKAWQAKKEIWQEINFPDKLKESFLQFREEFSISSYKLRLEKSLIRFITLEGKEYPRLLKSADRGPFLLYIKGEVKVQDSLAITVVGTRRITSYGRQATERLVSSLVANNVVVVSGLARGVDSAAHRAALKYGGRTLAVVGHGLDTIYPPENKALSEKICQQGALISQFPLGLSSLPGNFPARNKTLAGLGLGTVVVEGSSDSGSLITAGFAKELGRPVFAVPGPITSQLSAGPSRLIKEGAKLVTKGEDILINLKTQNSKLKTTAQNLKLLKSNSFSAKKELKFSNQTEEKIWQTLTSGIKHLDEVVREVGSSASEVSSALTQMELKGMIKNLGNGEYCL